jgi:hypothetical protein
VGSSSRLRRVPGRVLLLLLACPALSAYAGRSGMRTLHKARAAELGVSSLAMTSTSGIAQDGSGVVALQRVIVGSLVVAVCSSLAVNLGGPMCAKLTADAAAGTLAAIAVTPLVALVDSAVARSIAEKTPPTAELLRGAMEIARAPLQALYRMDFYFTCLVYLCTYLTANVCTTMGASSLTRLILITGANMWTGVRKDAFIASQNRRSGMTTTRDVPAASLALFCARDINAIGGSFVLPLLLAPHMATLLPHLAGRSAVVACQLISPPICELVNTPLHLLALDVYNRPGCSILDRARVIARQYPRSVMVRLLRVLAAFSLGGIGNRTLRAFFLQMLGLGV